MQKLHHALAALRESHGIQIKKVSETVFDNLLQKNIAVREWIVKQIHDSRAKDYQNPFRKMIYETEEEMNKIIGSLQDNSFIKHEKESLAAYKKTVAAVAKKMTSKPKAKVKAARVPEPAGG